MKKLLFLSLLFSVALNAMESNNHQFPAHVIKRAQQTNLIKACQNGNIEVVRYFIANGADINKAGSWGETPLHIASGNDCIEICQLLLNHGADVNKADNDRDTPLYWAAEQNNAKVCQLLIHFGADINKAGSWGKTALHLASVNNYIEICQLLLNHGADVTKVNNWGDTPLNCEYNELKKIMLEEYAAKHSSTKQKDRMYRLIAINSFRHLPTLPKNIVKLICLDHLPEAEIVQNACELIQERVQNSKKQELLALFSEAINQNDDAQTNE